MRTFLTRAKDSFILQLICDAAPGIIAAAVLILIYSVVQWNDDRTDRQEKTALVCPPEVDGLVFTHSGYTKLDITRPGSVSLNCYYSRGKK